LIAFAAGIRELCFRKRFFRRRGPMSFNPLAPVVDYQSMLNRIFWFVSVSALERVRF
jgi:hypothetical protein